MSDNSTIIKVGAVAVAAYVAYSQGWLSFLGIGTTATTTTPSAGALTSSPVVPSAPATPTTVSATALQPATRSLDSIYAAMLAAATAAGTTSTGVDGWGYYLNQVPGVVAPDPILPFTAANPNFDRSQNMSAAQYWAVIAPVLKTQYGLSGLGIYGGLGALMRRYA